MSSASSAPQAVPRAASVPRALAASGAVVLLTLALTLAVTAVVDLVDGGEPLVALVYDAPRLVLGTLGLMLPPWAILMAFIAVRGRRAPGRRVLMAQSLTSLGCAVLATLVWFVVALVQGAWALLLVALSAYTALVFAACAVTASFLVYRWRDARATNALPLAGGRA